MEDARKAHDMQESGISNRDKATVPRSKLRDIGIFVAGAVAALLASDLLDRDSNAKQYRSLDLKKFVTENFFDRIQRETYIGEPLDPASTAYRNATLREIVAEVNTEIDSFNGRLARSRITRRIGVSAIEPIQKTE